MRRSIRRIDDLGPKQYKIMHEYEVKYCEKYPVVGVLLGTGTPMGVDFVPAEGTLADALAADQQQEVSHAQLTRDHAKEDQTETERKPRRTENTGGGASQDSSTGRLQCPAGHFLVCTKTVDATYHCDGCGAAGLPKNAVIQSCRQCDFDLCEGCVAAREVEMGG